MNEGIPVSVSSDGATAVIKHRREDLPLHEMDWIGDFAGGMQRGGVYLLGGSPGSRKSGLALQLALDLTLSGMRSLFLLSEETPARLYDRAFPMMSDWTAAQSCGGVTHIATETTMPPLVDLPQFVTQQILTPGGKWHGQQFPLVVIDSIQGNGLPSTAVRHYRGLIEATRLLATAGITSLLISHVTKDGRLAGPSAIEHAVDVVIVIKKTALGRALFIPKNRFGPAHLSDPLLLELDDVTLRLNPSSHAIGTVTSANGYAGSNAGVVDLQASIALAAYGTPGRLRAVGITKAELKHLIAAVSRIDGIHLNDLDFCIDVRLPGCRHYLPGMGLALATALVGAYLQKPVPDTNLYLGEIDLAGAIRPLETSLLNQLAADMAAGMTLKVNDAVRVIKVPHSLRVGHMLGQIGFIEETKSDGMRAFVQGLTIDGRPTARAGWVPIPCMEPVTDPAWVAAVVEYHRWFAELVRENIERDARRRREIEAVAVKFGMTVETVMEIASAVNAFA